jgi:hypothetical protein
MDRPAIKDRAGTHLKRSACEPIYGTGKSHRQIGTLDNDQRVFQCGGEISNFLYKSRMLISLPWDVWEQVRLRCDWLEIVDHEENVCYRVHVSVGPATTTTVSYSSSSGAKRHEQIILMHSRVPLSIQAQAFRCLQRMDKHAATVQQSQAIRLRQLRRTWSARV